MAPTSALPAQRYLEECTLISHPYCEPCNLLRGLLRDLALLHQDNQCLRQQILGHCARIVAQSDLLTRRAETTMSAGHAGYLQLLEEMKALHLRKAADYGRADDPLANLRKSREVGIDPCLGAWLRAKDKVQRIDSFFLKGTLTNESLEDSLLDLAAYCLLALTLRREEALGRLDCREE